MKARFAAALATFCGMTFVAHATVLANGAGVKPTQSRGAVTASLHKAAAAGRAPRVTRSQPHSTGAAARVAVQPFDGPNSEPLRGLVARIVRGRGFRTMTSLPYYDGTGQYPSLARDHHLSAFITADLEERGHWQRITFLVWNGVSGSVVGRWTASAPTAVLGRAIGKGFWQHLGPAISKAEAPRLPPGMEQAPPMRIDASNPVERDVERVAARE